MANISKTVADAAGSALEAVGLGSRKRGTPSTSGSQTFTKTHPDTTKYSKAKSQDNVPAGSGSTVDTLRKVSKRADE